MAGRAKVHRPFHGVMLLLRQPNAGPVEARGGHSSVGPRVTSLRVSITYGLLLLLVPGIVLVDSAIGFLGQGQKLPGLPLSPGELVRGLVVSVGLLVLCFSRREELKRLRSYVLILICLGLTGGAVGLLVERGQQDLFFDLQQLVRVLVGPVFVLVLSAIFVRFGVKWKSVLSAVAWYGAVSGALIILLRIVGAGLPTYGSYSEAFAGFFAAPNDTGLAMVISLVASFYLFARHRQVVHGVTSVLTAGGLLILGTRAGLLGAVLAPAGILLLGARRMFTLRRWFTSILLAFVCLMGLLAFNRYREVRLERDAYQAARLSRLLSSEFNRVRLGERALRYVAGRPLYENLLGEGSTAYRRGDADERTPASDLLAEVDWIDLVGSHGILFTLAIYIFYLRYLFRRSWAQRAGDPGLRSVLAVALLAYLAHASVAGHGLTSPTASGVIAPLLAYLTVFGSARNECKQVVPTSDEDASTADHAAAA